MKYYRIATGVSYKSLVDSLKNYLDPDAPDFAQYAEALKAMGFKCRVAAKREQRGDRNDAWRGNEATYAAMHKRVEAVRGKPSQCELCGVAGVECEWANQSGNYADVNDYKRLCLPCHRKLDAFRRAACGRSTCRRPMAARRFPM